MGKRKKQQTPEEQLQILLEKGKEALARWNYLYTQGGRDPFYTDGVNLDLVRNHIIYFNREIAVLQSSPVQMGLFGQEIPVLPPAIPVPPKVPMDYMARKSEIYRRAKELYKVCMKTEEKDRPHFPNRNLEQLRKAIEKRDYVDMRRCVYLGQRKEDKG